MGMGQGRIVRRRDAGYRRGGKSSCLFLFGEGGSKEGGVGLKDGGRGEWEKR